jgi:hypothetical protein
LPTRDAKGEKTQPTTVHASHFDPSADAEYEQLFKEFFVEVLATFPKSPNTDTVCVLATGREPQTFMKRLNKLYKLGYQICEGIHPEAVFRLMKKTTDLTAKNVCQQMQGVANHQTCVTADKDVTIFFNYIARRSHGALQVIAGSSFFTSCSENKGGARALLAEALSLNMTVSTPPDFVVTGSSFTLCLATDVLGK